jgi:hypothetical protein
VEKEPVVVTVFHEGRVLDRILFGKQGTEGKGLRTEYTVRRRYELPVTPGKTERLILEVSRTWIPHEHVGNFDRRKLGVGVKIVSGEP